MRVELHVISGSRAGQRELFNKSVITIGRHPINDFKFHPEKDPDVSSKHAEIRLLESAAVLRDLSSTNGTYVNGQQVQGERALMNGDVIAFGREGPTVEVRVVTQVADMPATRQSNASPVEGQAGVGSPEPGVADTLPGGRQWKAEGRAAKAGGAPPRRDTSIRIAEAVEKQTGKLRTMVIGLAGLVVVGVGGAWWIGHSNATRAQAQIDALLRKNDSLNLAFEQTVSSMKGKVARYDTALLVAKADRERLRARIRSEMEKGGANVQEMAAQLDASEGRQRALAGAAQVDYEAISARNQPAMVFVVVQHLSGESVSGTGFNVARGGLVVTNRHVVQDAKGQPAKQILVAFEGTTGRWKKAHVLKVSPTDELAFIKIDEGGPYPVIAGVARDATPHVGMPGMILGYPFGTATAGMSGNIDMLTPRSTFSVATVSKVLADTLQFDTYAAEGSSGSPVFDARGLVIGVLYGGQAESSGRIVYAVPGQKLAAQMPPEGAGIVR